MANVWYELKLIPFRSTRVDAELSTVLSVLCKY